MKMHENLVEKTEEGPNLDLRPRPTEPVSLAVPVDTLSSLRKVAAQRDMSVEALLKWYIGQGLRQDLARSYSDRVLTTTAEVLARHLPSEEVPAILKEIQTESSVND
jgi:hypothetical protein